MTQVGVGVDQCAGHPLVQELNEHAGQEFGFSLTGDPNDVAVSRQLLGLQHQALPPERRSIGPERQARPLMWWPEVHHGQSSSSDVQRGERLGRKRRKPTRTEEELFWTNGLGGNICETEELCQVLRARSNQLRFRPSDEVSKSLRLGNGHHGDRQRVGTEGRLVDAAGYSGSQGGDFCAPFRLVLGATVVLQQQTGLELLGYPKVDVPIGDDVRPRAVTIGNVHWLMAELPLVLQLMHADIRKLTSQQHRGDEDIVDAKRMLEKQVRVTQLLGWSVPTLFQQSLTPQPLPALSRETVNGWGTPMGGNSGKKEALAVAGVGELLEHGLHVGEGTRGVEQAAHLAR